MAIRNVRRCAADLGDVVAADWRAAETIVAVSRGGEGLVSQVSVDGLTLGLRPSSNLTPPLRAVAAAPNRPVLVTDQGGVWSFAGGDLETWRQVVGGVPDAVPLYPADGPARCGRPVDNSARRAAVRAVASSRFARHAAGMTSSPSRALAAALLDLVLPARAAAAARRARAGAPPARPASRPPWPVLRGGPPVPRSVATPGPCARPSSPTRSGAAATWPSRSPACSPGPSTGRRRAVGEAVAGAIAGVDPAPGTPRGRWWLVPAPSRPAAARARGGDHVLRLCRDLARGDPRLRVAPALAAGQAGARLGRAGRRGAGGEPGGAAAGWRPGLPPAAARSSSSTTSSPQARPCACRSALGREGQHVTAAVVWPTRHADKIKKYPMGRRENYALSHLTGRGHSTVRSVA